MNTESPAPGAAAPAVDAIKADVAATAADSLREELAAQKDLNLRLAALTIADWLAAEQLARKAHGPTVLRIAKVNRGQSPGGGV